MAEKNYTPDPAEMSTTSLPKKKKSRYKPKRPHGFGHVVTYQNRRSPYVAFFNDANGEQKSKSFADRDEAEKFLDSLFLDRERLAQYTTNGNVTLAAYSELFLEKQKDKEKKGKIKKTSLGTKEDNIRRVVDCLGMYNLSQIDSAVIEKQLVDVLWEKGFSSSIMIKCKNIAIEMLRSAAADKYIRSVPVVDFVMPKPKAKIKSSEDEDNKSARVNYMSDTEVTLYTEECKRTYTPGRGAKQQGQTIPVYATGYRLLLLLHTGLRLSEALALEWTDFDDFSKTLKVDKNLVHTRDGKILQTPKTESGERVIILNKDAYNDLLELRKIYDQQLAIIDQREHDELEKAKKELTGKELAAASNEITKRYRLYRAEHKYICGSSKFPFGAGDHNGTLHTHKKVCNAIGLNHNVTVHGLRHTYVTHYYLKHHKDEDFDLVLFSRSIGHASVRTTLEIYAHLNMAVNTSTQRAVKDLKDF